MSPPSASVTSSDVARQAGVSRATVSYVINDRPGIPAATRRRVLAAVDALGYVPSGAARALRTGSSDLVVLHYPEWTIGHVTGLIIRHLTALVEDLGLALVTSQMRADGPQAWSALAPRAVLGLFPLPAAVRRGVERSGCRHIITVQTTRDRRRQRLSAPPTVGQLTHLADRGHRRVGFAAEIDPTLAWFSQRRFANLSATAATLGLPAPTTMEVGTDPSRADAAVRRWSGEGTDSVAAYNDDVALAVCAAARRLGVAVPGELAVIGLDNTPAGACASPALTSVDTAPEIVARHLAARLDRALNGTRRPVPCPAEHYTVVQRATT